MKEYSGHSGSRQGRYKLKDGVLIHYGEKLIFLKPEFHASELVISKECLSGQIFSRNSAAFKEFTVQKAALLLRESIVEAMEHAPVTWSDIVMHLGDFHTMMAYFGGDWPILLRQWIRGSLVSGRSM